jgi:predicted CoA-binding protein
MNLKKTVVIGASPNPERFSYKAVQLLNSYKHPVVAVGIRDGQIAGIEIQQGHPEIRAVHTVTLYIGAKRQPEYYNYLFDLKPKRIIFNPGTENPDLYSKAKGRGIEVVENCTLVMLNSGIY